MIEKSVEKIQPLEAKYTFIRDDVYLIGKVDRETSDQELIIQKVDLETNEILYEERKDCIHTAVTTITPDEYDFWKDSDYQDDLLEKEYKIKAQSTEELEEIYLEPEERFIALKSWVAGIAEAGINSFYIQGKLDNCLDKFYPLCNFLFNFTTIHNITPLEDFLVYVEENCKYEGSRHENSTMANLEIVNKYLDRLLKEKKEDQYQKELEKISNYDFSIKELDVILDKHPDLIKGIFNNYELKNKNEKEIIFNHRKWEVREKVAKNLKATEYEEYSQLINDEESLVQYITALNPGAPKFNEYKKFFNFKSMDYKRALAGNPNAPRFDEYKQFINDSDSRIRLCAAKNPNATKFKEFKQLFIDPDLKIRTFLANNPKSINIDGFEKLFYDENSEIRLSLAKNSKATRFKEFKNLFKDEDFLVQEAAFDNPSFTKFDKFKYKFLYENWPYYAISLAIGVYGLQCLIQKIIK